MSASSMPTLDQSAAARWARIPTIRTGEDYVDSLRGRGLTVYLFGELVDEPVDHPIIAPSINALRAHQPPLPKPHILTHRGRPSRR